MPKYNLDFDRTLTASNMEAAFQKIREMISVVDAVRVKVEYDTAGADAPFTEEQAFTYMEGLVGADSVVSINVTEE